MNKIKIRTAKISDAPKILYLGKRMEEFAVSKDYKFYSTEEIAEWIKNPRNNIFLIAEYGQKLAGFLFAKIISKNWCMIDGVGVGNNFRKRGIGKTLLKKLLEILKKKKVYLAQVFVGLENKNGLGFWKKSGFKAGKKFIWLEKKVSFKY